MTMATKTTADPACMCVWSTHLLEWVKQVIGVHLENLEFRKLLQLLGLLEDHGQARIRLALCGCSLAQRCCEGRSRPEDDRQCRCGKGELHCCCWVVGLCDGRALCGKVMVTTVAAHLGKEKENEMGSEEKRRIVSRTGAMNLCGQRKYKTSVATNRCHDACCVLCGDGGFVHWSASRRGSSTGRRTDGRDSSSGSHRLIGGQRPSDTQSVWCRIPSRRNGVGA